jgi:hypothetical protein
MHTLDTCFYPYGENILFSVIFAKPENASIILISGVLEMSRNRNILIFKSIYY